MAVSIPPLAAKSQSPDGVCAAWSWYWGRVWSGGCQQAPAIVSQATGGGQLSCLTGVRRADVEGPVDVGDERVDRALDARRVAADGAAAPGLGPSEGALHRVAQPGLAPLDLRGVRHRAARDLPVEQQQAHGLLPGRLDLARGALLAG